MIPSIHRGRAVVVLSGGQDSTTCLFFAKALGYELHAITFDYGQRHRIEIEAARTVGKLAGVKTHRLVKLGEQYELTSHPSGIVSGILEGTSPLVSNTHLEQYEHYSTLPGGLEKTFVPMRNQLFLTIAANRAFVLGTNELFTGVSAEDYGGYPDCRSEFIERLAEASSLGTFNEEAEIGNLRIVTPLMRKTKRETVLMALELEGCYEALAYTHTSYDGQYPPTGHDHATLLRAKGFEEAGVPDPLILRAWFEGRIFELPDTPNYDLSDKRVLTCEQSVRELYVTVRTNGYVHS